MKRFVAGADRAQSTLLPESLDDWVDESNPVRVIDAFVDALNVAELGFEGVERLIAPTPHAASPPSGCQMYKRQVSVMRDHILEGEKSDEHCHHKHCYRDFLRI